MALTLGRLAKAGTNDGENQNIVDGPEIATAVSETPSDDRMATEKAIAEWVTLNFALASHDHDGVYDVVGAAAAVQTNLEAHTGRTDNPHGTTAALVGAIATGALGVAGGVATLDETGRLTIAQVPSFLLHYLGFFATPTALRTAYETAGDGDYANVGSTDTMWAWDSDTEDWVDTGGGGAVSSVNGQTGVVSLSYTDVGAAPAAKGVTNGDSHDHLGGDGGQIAYGSLSGVPGTFAPSAHASSHKSGGTDAIKLDELAAPTDTTALNVSASAHGLVPKTPNDADKVLLGNGTWGDPPSSGGGSSNTWEIKTAAYTAAPGDAPADLNGSGGSFTVTLTATPTANVPLKFGDHSGTWYDHNITIDGNGTNIRTPDGEVGATLILSVAYATVTLFYLESEDEWIVTEIC